jgi:hypothetical protein
MVYGGVNISVVTDALKTLGWKCKVCRTDMPKKKAVSQWCSCLNCRWVHQVLPHTAMVASEISTIRKRFLTGIAALVIG